MSIKYNEFGEVISVNGLTVGQHMGAPMQDAIAEKHEDNQAYGTQLNTVTRCENVVEDEQPEVIPTIQSAEIGQTLMVKAVDENGKPTEWEATDLPSGGGNGGNYDAIISLGKLYPADAEVEALKHPAVSKFSFLQGNFDILAAATNPKIAITAVVDGYSTYTFTPISCYAKEDDMEGGINRVVVTFLYDYIGGTLYKGTITINSAGTFTFKYSAV